jgi:hypothetical protein
LGFSTLKELNNGKENFHLDEDGIDALFPGREPSLNEISF